MSFVHCPTCSRAFRLALGRCPHCAPKQEPTVLAALDDLARAIATATPEQLGAAWATLAAQHDDRERHVVFDDGVESVALVGRRSEPAATTALTRKRDRLAELGRSLLAVATGDQPFRFLFAKSQFTSFQNSSMYLGRAFR